MVKIYQKYESHAIFGIILGQTGNIAFLSHGSLLAAPQQDHVGVWRLQTGKQIGILDVTKKKSSYEGIAREDLSSVVTSLVASPNGDYVVAGFSEGEIAVWNYSSELNSVNGRTTGLSTASILSGHVSKVNCLAFSEDGLYLASGGNDCSIVVWDFPTQRAISRLRGHGGPVSRIKFLNSRLLVSCSIDSVVKFWDVEIKRCTSSTFGPKIPLWDFCVVDRLVDSQRKADMEEDLLFIGGGNSNSLQVWDPKKTVTVDNEIPMSPLADVQLTRIHRVRVIQKVKTIDGRNYILVAGKSRYVEIFKVLTSEDVLRKKKRKEKRKKIKNEGEEASNEVHGEQKGMEVDVPLLEPFCEIRVGASVTSMLLEQARKGDQREGREVLFWAIFGLSSNSIEKYALLADKTAYLERSIESLGHREDIRALTFSNDSSLIATVDRRNLKVWKHDTTRIISIDRSIPPLVEDYGGDDEIETKKRKLTEALCVCFLPKDGYACVGDKNGDIELYSIRDASMHCLMRKAHEGAIWGLSTISRRTRAGEDRLLVSSGTDKRIRFWKLVGRKMKLDKTSVVRLWLKLVGEHDLPDGALSLALSTTGNIIMVSLLDNTVSLLQEREDSEDGFPEYSLLHTLYGHSLPVLCVDITSDSELAITGSADKTVKVWGVKFGDCHKSFHAHEGSVLDVKSVPDTHYFFSSGKDGLVKYWDADSFQQLMSLQAHQRDVWSLGLTKNGDWLASTGADKSIRIWGRSEENQFVLEEAIEEEQNRMIDDAEKQRLREEAGMDFREGKATETGAAILTSDVISASEKVIDSLKLIRGTIEGEDNDIEEAKRALGGKTRATVLHAVIKNLNASSLETILTTLPLYLLKTVFVCMNEWIKEDYNLMIPCRVVFFVLSSFYKQIRSQDELLPIVEDLRSTLDEALHRKHAIVGQNGVVLRMMMRKLEKERNMVFFDDSKAEEVKRKKKR